MSRTSTSAAEIETRGLSSGYGTAEVLRGVSFRLEAGRILGVIGRNGVGKTTLVKTIVGLLPAIRGSVFVHGREVTRTAAHLIARMGVGYVPQGRSIFPRMTVKEHLVLGGYLVADDSDRAGRLDLVYSVFPILKQRGGQIAGSLSGGEQEMLAIGRAISGNPSILILDEPSDGVQPNVVNQIGDVIVQLQAEMGLSVILIDQNAALISKCVDQAHAMDKGQIIATLDAAEVRDESRLTEVLSLLIASDQEGSEP